MYILVSGTLRVNRLLRGFLRTPKLFQVQCRPETRWPTLTRQMKEKKLLFDVNLIIFDIKSCSSAFLSVRPAPSPTAPQLSHLFACVSGRCAPALFCSQAWPNPCSAPQWGTCRRSPSWRGGPCGRPLSPPWPSPGRSVVFHRSCVSVRPWASQPTTKPRRLCSTWPGWSAAGRD